MTHSAPLPALADSNSNHGSRAFLGFTDFSGYEAADIDGARVLTSPLLTAPIAWDELIVSWNASAPTGTFLKIEAQAIYPETSTPFYVMGLWSTDASQHPRASVTKQKDEHAKVSTDTLILTKPAKQCRVRLTLGTSTTNARPELKFIGLSFLDSKAPLPELPPNKSAWGRIIETPERSQNSYPEEKGWCSPTSLAMVLMRWSEELGREDLNQDVRVCAAAVLDSNYGTGNWPFNTAYAGSFPGMRAYITRLAGLPELEEWIAAGVPVIISAPFHLLEPGRKDTGSGHVVTVIGFTDDGDVVINDPATNLEKGQKVRHIYQRKHVANAWGRSHHTAYLIYPVGSKNSAKPAWTLAC